MFVWLGSGNVALLYLSSYVKGVNIELDVVDNGNLKIFSILSRFCLDDVMTVTEIGQLLCHQ